MTELTESHFTALFPRAKNPQDFTLYLRHILAENDISTQRRVSAFLAQTGHECGGYRVFIENLNYSADALNRVFAKYFKNCGVDATAYHRKKEKIANRVYANRMGNGDEASGDGWKYRGRGIIQLTGKANYTAFSQDTQIDVISDPDKILYDIQLLILTGVWYWKRNDLNKYADNGDMEGLTRRINGGLNGYEHRLELWNKSLRLWKEA